MTLLLTTWSLLLAESHLNEAALWVVRRIAVLSLPAG
jgi:hypothetical protein